MSDKQSKNTYQAATIWQATNPNYPGVPQPPDDQVVAKTSTSSRSVDYYDYVLTYTARQRNHAFMVAAGVALGVATAIYLSGPWLIICVVLAIGLMAAGGAAFLIMAQAHADYTQLLQSHTVTYADPRPVPVADVRPVIPTDNNTIRRGRFTLPADQWSRLFDAARAHKEGRLTRDNIVKAKALPRLLYHGDAFEDTLAELKRLGIIDSGNRITAAGRAFEQEIRSPHPAAPSAPTFVHSTNGNERTAANEVWP